ncbi:MAG: FtsX-like permease family protein [Lachnospiraceae bacterium]|nr:FtsX-like permease family protein [Lachnospiraceae bacterium]
MLFKISLRNIKRSIKDYAIYFFTLIIGVSIFYVFNAISTQTAMLQLDASEYDIIKMLQGTLSVTSIFVAVILALLIVYASRFLMKRRHKEFAIYQTLGMGKGQISLMLFFETVVIGVASLAVGLFLGTGLSQIMSAVVADLFEADMTAYKFMFSADSARKTVFYFALMYLAVIVLNNLAITKMKLIDLIQSGKRTEHVTNRNVFLCLITFVAAVIALAYAYRQVGWEYTTLDEKSLVFCIVLGAASTFLIFWSVSGVVLRVIMLMKRTYYRSINAFTFRQISSVINTMVFSMTIICLMIFITICTIASSFAIRNSMNANINKLCPADIEVCCNVQSDESEQSGCDSIRHLYELSGYSIDDHIEKSVEFYTYMDSDLTIAKSMGPFLEEIKESLPHLAYETPEVVMTVSDYNRVMDLFGKDEIKLNQGEYIVMCNFKTMKDVRDYVMKSGTTISVYGNELKPMYKECQDGFIELSASNINTGIYIVPDDVVENQEPKRSYFIGDYEENSDFSIDEIEKMQIDRMEKMEANSLNYTSGLVMDTRKEILGNAIGLGAILAFLGLYIGFVFLVSCGAILSLKCLSESVDGQERYKVLRKIGVDERVISKSLLIQTGVCFFAPLSLAIIHSIVGMRFARFFLETFGTEAVMQSIGLSTVILLVIYGGYFVITYCSSKNIISE